MTRFGRLLGACALLGAGLALRASTSFAQTPLDTSFTYQGRLLDGGAPADGAFDFEFSLFDAETGGTQIGPGAAFNGVVVTGGLVNVELDFGPGAFEGEERWLQIALRPAGGGALSTLAPRRQVQATPSAQYAMNADALEGFSAADLDFRYGAHTFGEGFFEESRLSAGLGGFGNIALAGDFLYAVDSSSNVLAIFDVSDPNNIVPRDTDGTGLASPQAVAVAGNFAYVANTDLGVLAIFDVSDPDNIVPRGSGGTGLVFPQAMAVAGGFAYVVDSGGGGVLAIFDVSDPDNIVPRGADGTGLAGPRAVAVAGSFAYVADVNTDVLAIFGVSDPDNIVPRGAFGNGLLPFPEAIVTQGSLAYVVDSGNHVDNDDGAVLLLDVSDPDDIKLLARTPFGALSESTGLALHGDAVLVRERDGGFLVSLFPRETVGRFFAASVEAVSLSAMDASVSNLSADSADIESLSANSADIGSLSANSADVSDLSAVGASVLNNLGVGTSLPVARLHVQGGTDTALGGGGYVVLGNTTGLNISIDSNEMMARNNGAASTLSLQNDGGLLNIGGAALIASSSGSAVAPLQVLGGSDASLSGGGFLVLGDPAGTSVVIDSNEMMARNNGAAATLFLQGDGGALEVGGALRAPALATGAGLSVQWNSANGQFMVFASSSRFKTDIQDADIDPGKILELSPKTFRYAGTGQQASGYMAEELDALGLSDLVAYNEEGAPEGIHYDLIPLYLNELAKVHEARLAEKDAQIEALEAQLAEQDARLERLEALLAPND